MSAHGDAAYQELVQRYGHVPASPTLPDLFTSMFMHANVMHLGGNMLYLWIFGDNVEGRLGHVGYLAAYLATGLVAGTIHGIMDPASAVPSLGASGAISGVQGLYLVAYPKNRVRLLLLFFPFVRVVLVPALWIILFWFVLNDLLPSLTRGADVGGVAHRAHLGGAAAGIVLCLALKPFFPDRRDDKGSTRFWRPEDTAP